MPGVIDADTHIIEHPGVWELFDEAMYERRPKLASMSDSDDRRSSVWMIDGAADPQAHG